jgi:hypothetical protein
VLLAAAVLAVVVAAAACQPAHQDPPTVHAVVVVGDSLADGAKPAPGIVDHLPAEFPNATIRRAGGPATGPLDGFDPKSGTSNWSRELTAILHGGDDADLVVIETVGRNFATADVWKAALDAVVAAARADDPTGHRRVVMVTSPRIVPGTSIFEVWGVAAMIEGNNAVMRAYPDIGLADVDLAWAVDGKPVWDVPGVGVGRYADGLHYSEAGAADAARIVATA